MLAHKVAVDHVAASTGGTANVAVAGTLATPLILSAHKGDLAIVEALLNGHAEMERTDAKGMTAGTVALHVETEHVPYTLRCL